MVKQTWIGRTWVAVFVCALSAFILLMPRLLFARIAWPGDLYIHYLYADQFVDALRDGVLYPRWTAMSFGGLGQATFIYYAPLYYYVVALFWLIVSDVYTAMLIVDFLSLWFMGFVVWWICRRLGCRPWYCLLGMLCIQCSPAVQMNYSQMSGLPALLAYGLVGLALYYAAIALTEGRGVDLRVTVVLALLTLTHLLSAYMFLICVGIMALCWMLFHLFDFRRVLPGLFYLAISCFLGLALSAVFLLPALTSLGYINQEYWTESVIWQEGLILPFFTQITTWWIFQWLIAGLFLSSVFVITIYVKRSRANPTVLWNTAVVILLLGWGSLFLAGEWAYYIWMLVPPIQKIQFGYRLFVITSLVVSILLPFVLDSEEIAIDRRGRLYVWALVLLVVGLGCSIVVRSALHKPIDVGKYLATYKNIQKGQKEYLPSIRNQGWIQYIAEGGLKTEVQRNKVSILTEQCRTHEKKWQLDAFADTELRLPVFSYPAWSAFIDGQKVEWQNDADTGLIALQIKMGKHDIQLKWTALWQERYGGVISLTALGVCVFVYRRRKV